MKKPYRAAPGVASVNGEAVPEDDVIHLTPSQAVYDLAHGRIVPHEAEPAADGQAPPPAARTRRRK